MIRSLVLACVLSMFATARADTRLELFDSGGRLAYLGSEQERVEGDGLERTVRYCHPDGRLVFESKARFDAATRRVLSIRMKDHQADRTPAMKLADDKLLFTNGGSTTTVSRPADLYVSEGLEELIRARWASLSTGSAEEFHLAIPQHTRLLRFRLVRDREDDAALVLRLEPKLWMLRKLAEPVYYRVAKAAPHRLLETWGPSAVTDAAGNLQILRAVYTRADPRPLPCAERK